MRFANRLATPASVVWARILRPHTLTISGDTLMDNELRGSNSRTKLYGSEPVFHSGRLVKNGDGGEGSRRGAERPNDAAGSAPVELVPLQKGAARNNRSRNFRKASVFRRVTIEAPLDFRRQDFHRGLKEHVVVGRRYLVNLDPARYELAPAK